MGIIGAPCPGVWPLFFPLVAGHGTGFTSGTTGGEFFAGVGAGGGVVFRGAGPGPAVGSGDEGEESPGPALTPPCNGPLSGLRFG